MGAVVTHTSRVCLRSNVARLALAALALGAGACGSLDNVTDVHDLRVLAVRADPAGFLVPLDDPSSLTDAQAQAKVTALVVDPKSPSQILTVSGEACPDYIDTITSASAQTSKLCPSADVTNKLPGSLASLLMTTELPGGTAMATTTNAIEYDPQVTFGLSSAQLGLFFSSPTPADGPTIEQAIQYNRDFSFDAIVDLTFTLGGESAEALKHVVYWPLLPAALVPDPASNPDCPTTQTPNTNPTITSIDLFRQRTDGMPTDPWTSGTPTVSISAGDHLFVRPSYDPTSIEHYLLRVKNAATGLVETQCRHELLTFQFFATAGTFSPATRASELQIVRTADNGYIPLDSQFDPPKAADIPPGGVVTIWIVARDERAGASWTSTTFLLQP
jgi:hypothetical protein